MQGMEPARRLVGPEGAIGHVGTLAEAHVIGLLGPGQKHRVDIGGGHEQIVDLQGHAQVLFGFGIAMRAHVRREAVAGIDKNVPTAQAGHLGGSPQG